MGGLLNLFDSETRSMARKTASHKKHVDGLEAHRNSIKLRIENPPSFSAPRESPVIEDWSGNNYYPFEAPMKKLINEEISKNPSTRQNAPSIVARLMGMDAMATSDTRSSVHPIEKKTENARSKFSNKEANRRVVAPICHISCDSRSNTSQTRLEYCYPNGEEQSLGRSRRIRDHPQEEELQKFKKEFEAWQSVRFNECSRFAEQGNLPEKFPFHPQINEPKVRLKGHTPKEHTISAPTKIVILKPGPDGLYDSSDRRDSCSSSPSSSEQHRGSIEDFLEEVRERLKFEMQGKMLVKRGGGIETPFSEKPVDNPKQIAQAIARQARENLVRSESTRSYGYGPGSPEFISRDTKKFVSERLKNVKSGAHSRSYSALLDFDGDHIRDNRQRGVRDEQRMDRHRIVHGESYPRNLVRSLSAPVSGTSFAKLLLEDRHVLTGAHIRRKLEATEKVSEYAKKPKKEKLNLKQRVTSFRYSFSLRGRLFRKKIPPSPMTIESRVTEHFPLKDITSGPTVISSFCERNDNFTEVPPSPASVCSGVDHLSSPLSNLDLNPCDDYALPQVFREISSNLTELRRQLDQLESDEPTEEEIIPLKPKKSDFPELKDPSEAYVRDLLVASGLYDGSSSEKFMTKWETLSKPVSVSVFEEVEERYKKSSSAGSSNDHKLLHDLLNESLSAILTKPSSSSSSSSPSDRGKELLRCVWEMMCRHLRSSLDDRSSPLSSIDLVDDLVARDLRLRRWSGEMDDIVAGLTRELECVIMADLVQEILEDMRVF